MASSIPMAPCAGSSRVSPLVLAVTFRLRRPFKDAVRTGVGPAGARAFLNVKVVAADLAVQPDAGRSKLAVSPVAEKMRRVAPVASGFALGSGGGGSRTDQVRDCFVPEVRSASLRAVSGWSLASAVPSPTRSIAIVARRMGTPVRDHAVVPSPPRQRQGDSGPGGEPGRG